METIYLLNESANILVCDVPETERWRALENARHILEDAASPTTRRFEEKLYQSIIKKGHINFDGIEKSEGDIVNYVGYKNMIDTLNTIDQLAKEQRATNVQTYTRTVMEAISSIRNLSATYKRGFQLRNEFVMMEYCTYVYTCVEATSALIYEFVDYIKRPDKAVMTVQLKNTTIRANLFYFQQLEKFNKVQSRMGMEYRKMLETALSKGKSNFIGIDDMMLGYGALALIAMAAIPITRELIYQFYNLRKNASRNLELQAQFLEMNRIAVENNESLTADKRKRVLDKQAKLAQQLRRLASFLRVESVTAVKKTKKDLESDNKDMTLSKVKDDVENSPITLF